MNPHLTLRTEYSFKQCFLPMKNIHRYAVNDVVGIADEHNTFGHIHLQEEAKRHGLKPVYGVRLFVVPEEFTGRTFNQFTIIIARTESGLGMLNSLVEQAWFNFHYFPRITPELLDTYEDSEEIYILHPGEETDDNQYGEPEDRAVYELMAGSHQRGESYSYNFSRGVKPGHVIPAKPFNKPLPAHIVIPQAEMVRLPGRDAATALRATCESVLDSRGCEREYWDRFEYEYQLIVQKGYADYFMIVADMVHFAKKKGILVGPARGSAAGSLICYLLCITEVDPIEHDLVFERFIDLNRSDLPDIDIDFPDGDRKKVIDYLGTTYGHNRVAGLANINRFALRGALNEFAKGLNIPLWELNAVKNTQATTFEGLWKTDAGKELLEKFPKMELATQVEGHASHGGKHAAAVLVSTHRLTNYAPYNARNECIMLDKQTADMLNLLKIDVLGLTTLSIIQDTCKAVGFDPQQLYKLSLNDPRPFQMINRGELSGVFQFEGQALRQICRKLEVRNFNDMAAITALARPGALSSGGTAEYIAYANGHLEPRFYNQDHRDITGDTYGVIVYQEQMMEIARRIGKMSPADVSELRRGASKNKGPEFMEQYREKFLAGAPRECHPLWDQIQASGAWAFNKSHSVGYSIISYWTALLKERYLLEFSAAYLNHTKDEKTRIRYLREIVKNGVKMVPFCPQRSKAYWSVKDGELIGGVINVDKVGITKAKQFVSARDKKLPFKPWMHTVAAHGMTPYDNLFPAESRWGNYYNDAATIMAFGKTLHIKDVVGAGIYQFLGKVVGIEEREGTIRVRVEDDTDTVTCKITPSRLKQALPAKFDVDDWVMVRGLIYSDEWRTVSVNALILL